MHWGAKLTSVLVQLALRGVCTGGGVSETPSPPPCPRPREQVPGSLGPCGPLVCTSLISSYAITSPSSALPAPAPLSSFCLSRGPCDSPAGWPGLFLGMCAHPFSHGAGHARPLRGGGVWWVSSGGPRGCRHLCSASRVRREEAGTCGWALGQTGRVPCCHFLAWEAVGVVSPFSQGPSRGCPGCTAQPRRLRVCRRLRKGRPQRCTGCHSPSPGEALTPVCFLPRETEPMVA